MKEKKFSLQVCSREHPFYLYVGPLHGRGSAIGINTL